MLDESDAVASVQTIQASDVQGLVGMLCDNIAKAIVGRDDAVEYLLIASLAQGHVLVEDLPGTGKTTLCRALADEINRATPRAQSAFL
jgi:MoxR-like ATPase